MIKKWNKFNESEMSSYNHYIDIKDKLTEENLKQLNSIFPEIRECFISFEDSGLINTYRFGGLYNPDKSKEIDNQRKPELSNFTPQSRASLEEKLKSASDYYVPRYTAEWVSRFVSIGIDFPTNDNGWIGGEGVDLLDDVIESKNRLQSLGYEIELYFWKESQVNATGKDPLEIRVYFDMECEWPELGGHRGRNQRGED